MMELGASEFLIEIAPTSGAGLASDEFGPGTEKIANPGAGGALIKASATELRDSLRVIIAAVAESLKDAAPDAWSVEFGVGFKSTAGVPILVAGEASANLKVTLSWKRP